MRKILQDISVISNFYEFECISDGCLVLTQRLVEELRNVALRFRSSSVCLRSTSRCFTVYETFFFSLVNFALSYC